MPKKIKVGKMLTVINIGCHSLKRVTGIRWHFEVVENKGLNSQPQYFLPDP